MTTSTAIERWAAKPEIFSCVVPPATVGAPLGGLDPGAYTALWELSDAIGLRPEYLLPVLAYESSFDPSADNGAGYYGINQESGDQLQAMGINPQDYKTWSAGQQIRTVVAPRYKDLVRRFGPIESGAKAYQGNFLPETLATAKSLSSVLASRDNDPYHWYRDNPTLDVNKDGFITVGDLADLVTREAGDPFVKDAIARAYALRPSESPRNPALGTDFRKGLTHGQAAALGLGLVALAGTVAWWLNEPKHSGGRRHGVLSFARDNPSLPPKRRRASR
jgi:hypothetical protein